MLKLIKIFIITLISFLLITTTSFTAKSVILSWSANSEIDLAGYRLYQSDTSDNYVFNDSTSPNLLIDIPCGPNDITCCTHTKMADSGPGKYYVVTAYDNNNNESLPSNEVETLPPGKVKNLKKEHK